LDKFQHLQETYPWLLPILIVLIFWEMIWKIIAMWKSARNNHLAWFICIAVINTIGILPIVYILMRRKKPTKLLDASV
jgi:hypothetical protein